MAQSTPKRKIKDSVFTNLFQEFDGISGKSDYMDI